MAKKKSKPKDVAGVLISHPEKDVFPEIHLSKVELAEYYASIADLMLVEMAKRPLSLVRCPAGHTTCFFQKHLESTDTIEIPSVLIPDTGDGRGYPYAKDPIDIVEMVQLNTLEFHQWGCRIKNPDIPDRLVLDLDPGPDVTPRAVMDGALLLKDLFSQLKLQSFLKCTGGKGLHVVVPLTGRQSWDEVKGFAKKIADSLSASDPQRFVAVSTKSKRQGRIFVDYLRNGKGSTSIANYSTRARTGAPVAVPLEWKEIRRGHSLPHFSVTDIKKIKKERGKVWEGIYKVKQKIPSV